MRNTSLILFTKSTLNALMLLAAISGFEASFLAKAYQAYAFGGGGGGGEKSESEKKCEEAKKKRDEVCGDKPDSAKCEKEKEEKKKACGEETKEEQGKEEEEKEEDHAPKDTAALQAIDQHIAKIIQIRDNANSLNGQLTAILSQLEADAKSACYDSESFQTKKDEAIKKARDLKTAADSAVGGLTPANIDGLLGQINAEVGKVSEKYRGVATSKADVAKGYATEAKKHITEVDAAIIKIQDMKFAPAGNCNNSSSSASSTNNNVPVNQ